MGIFPMYGYDIQEEMEVIEYAFERQAALPLSYLLLGWGRTSAVRTTVFAGGLK
jgi:hypothetical protein